MRAQKTRQKQNQLTKQKQVTTKQQRQFFAHTKSSKRVKIIWFAFWSFFNAQNLFVKKIDRLKIILITSNTIYLNKTDIEKVG